MYKVDLKTLKKITKMLDYVATGKYFDTDDFKCFEKLELKAKKLSQKIKDNYTQIKK